MSSPTHFKRALTATILAAIVALAAGPAAANAAPVDLATATPFVVLAGSTATNEGSSVLNGNLGVSPGTSLTGFSEAVVNGATHENDAVAAQAQADLSNAYDVASEQPVAKANDLSGTDLGNRTLIPGAYRYSSSALLTGPLTLDAQGDPNAQFVFLIGSALTTESASSVNLINGASACNVYWQVGTSATLGTTTKFVGNLMALASISLNNGVTVEGRMLARNGQVSLISDVLSAPQCAAGPPTPPPTVETPTSGTPTGGGAPGTPNEGAPSSGATVAKGKSAKKHHAKIPVLDREHGTAIVTRIPSNGCANGFRATVRGHMIDRVAFTLDGKPIGTRSNAPYQISVRATPGAHRVSARVTFKDATPAKRVTFAYRACAAAVLAPKPGPSAFTG